VSTLALNRRVLQTRRRVLADGARVIVRPVECGDENLVRAVFEHLGPSSRMSRFLVPKHTLSTSDLRQLTSVDHVNHEAVAAYSALDRSPIGIARFIRDRDEPGNAEVAIEIVDEWQGRGVGGVLLTALVARARKLRVRRLSVLMAPDNHGASRLMRHLPGTVGQVGTDRQTAEYLVSLSPSTYVRAGTGLFRGV
jgi:RimJ/RimL family protein N-acetyltransferase